MFARLARARDLAPRRVHRRAPRPRAPPCPRARARASIRASTATRPTRARRRTRSTSRAPTATRSSRAAPGSSGSCARTRSPAAPTPRCVRQANYVVLDHGDGTFSEYHHLAPWGAAVRPGQTVCAGQLVGLCGATGYAVGAHLHWSVTDLSGLSVPFTIEESWEGGGIGLPLPDQSYVSGNEREDGCAPIAPSPIERGAFPPPGDRAATRAAERVRSRRASAYHRGPLVGRVEPRRAAPRRGGGGARRRVADRVRARRRRGAISARTRLVRISGRRPRVDAHAVRRVVPRSGVGVVVPRLYWGRRAGRAWRCGSMIRAAARARVTPACRA